MILIIFKMILGMKSTNIISEYNPPKKEDITILYCLADICNMVCVDFNRK